MKPKFFFIIFFGLLIILHGFADSSVVLLKTGRFHGNEIAAVSGEKWWGLYLTDSTAYLKPVTIQVERIKDNMLDKGTAKTGKMVSVTDTIPANWLFRDLNTAKSGSLLMAVPSQHYFFNDDTVRISFSDKTYKIAKTGGRGHAIVTLSYAGKSQLLFDHFLDEGSVAILWAGDLDRDGELDLLMDFSYKYSVDRQVLFLSAQAEDGQIVGEAAILHTTPGC